MVKFQYERDGFWSPIYVLTVAGIAQPKNKQLTSAAVTKYDPVKTNKTLLISTKINQFM